MSVSNRIGQFIFFVSLIALVIFYATYQSGEPQYGLFLPSLVGFFLGILLIWRGRSPSPPSGRFRMWNDAQSKAAGRKKKR